MDHRLVALMTVAIVLAGSVAGSVLHAPGVPIQHLLPLEVHSPLLLSQPLGLTVNEILAAAGHEPSPAPVSEVSLDLSAEAKQVLEIINSQHLSESGSSIAIGDAGTHLTVSGPTLPAPTAAGQPAPSSPDPESPPAPETPQPAPLPSPTTAPESPPSSAPTAVDNSAPAADVNLLDSITRGSLYIDANGKLQMQATVTSGDSELSVVASDLPQIVDTVVGPGVPVVSVAKPSKGVSNVNVNVNVNVNGDGTGSSFNATSVSKINAPIEVEHECH